jgi:hypothetical protein
VAGSFACPGGAEHEGDDESGDEFSPISEACRSGETKPSRPAVSFGEEVIVVERAALREEGCTLGGEQTTERTC